MTALFVGAALALAGCLRKMADQALSSPSISYDMQYERRTPELQLAQQKAAENYKRPSVNR